MPRGPRSRGWRWDEDNDRLHVNIAGTDTAYFDSTGLASGVATGSVTGPMLGSGWLKVSLVDGQDETTGPDLTYTLTGAALGDEVVSVIHITTKASIATMAVLTGYTITGTNELSSGSAVDLSSDQLMVTWIDHT
jgi:hypothetical protein